jgi:asparaginyl-tRNA synthetase
MEKITVSKLVRNMADYEGKIVSLEGWVRSNRNQKSFGFISLNDGTHFNSAQIVYEKELLNNFDQIAKLGVGSAVSLGGKMVLTPEAKQPFEIKAQFINIEGAAEPAYPIHPKRHSREFLREVAHLRPRTNLFSAVFRVRSALAHAVHLFFRQKEFLYLHTPIITANDAEGAGELFRVTTLDPDNPSLTADGSTDYSADFFGKKTNLTVSGQLEAEAYALAFKNVYTFGPTFRAENSNTARHAAEFWMIEPEIAFADLVDNMNLAEEMMKALINFLLEEAPDEMALFNNFVEKGLLEKLQAIASAKFARISYSEAINILLKANENFSFPVEWGKDLQTEHERYLTERVFKKPLFVTDYPADIKAFYMRLNDDRKTVAAMDLLVPGVGEIIGGSQREERIDLLKQRMAAMNISQKDLQWYLDLRKYGGVRHSGFGLGFERAIMYFTGISNIRDVIPFPRTVHSCDF